MSWLIHLVVPWLARAFFYSCARCPSLFAAVASTGLGVGTWLTFKGADLAIVLIGVFCFGFYSFLMVFLVIKVRRQEWVAFCHRAASEFE